MQDLRLPEAFCENPNLHAYLYVSADKADRRSVADRIAMSLLCKERNDNAYPCKVCSDCIKIVSGSHPDCFYFGSDGAKVRVEDIRTISERAYLAPHEAKGKVFILEEADTYNQQCQNALLKILEEPPKNVFFVLTASSKNALLSTVRSRVCALTGTEKTIDMLKKEISLAFPGISDSALRRSAYFAYSYDSADIKSINAEMIDTAFDTAVNFLSGTDDGIDPLSVPKKKDGILILLQVLMMCTSTLLKAKVTGLTQESALSEEEMSRLCTRVSTKRAAYLYDKYENAYLRLANNANENAIVSTLII